MQVEPVPPHETPEPGPSLTTSQSHISGTLFDNPNLNVLSSNLVCDADLGDPSAVEQPLMDETGSLAESECGNATRNACDMQAEHRFKSGFQRLIYFGIDCSILMLCGLLIIIDLDFAKLSPNFSFSWAEMDFILNFPHPTTHQE